MNEEKIRRGVVTRTAKKVRPSNRECEQMLMLSRTFPQLHQWP